MAETLLTLLTAHLVGDFVFQSRWMVCNKRKAPVLLLHVVIICLITGILLRNFQWQMISAIFVSHLIIDYLKLRLGDEGLGSFVLDQLAHLIVLIALTTVYPLAAAAGWWPPALQAWLPGYYAGLCLISGIVLIVPAGGILIGKLTAPIRMEIKKTKIPVQDAIASDIRKDDQPDEFLTAGLTNGGMYIGWLERLLTMLLMLIGQPTGIGFLIAAKSVLRFGEIKEAGHRKLAEYIIIGTFLSFGWALFVSVLMQRGIEHWLPRPVPESQPLRVILVPTPASPSPAPPSADSVP